jgi:hypothetical protein
MPGTKLRQQELFAEANSYWITQGIAPGGSPVIATAADATDASGKISVGDGMLPTVGTGMLKFTPWGGGVERQRVWPSGPKSFWHGKRVLNASQPELKM